jgi:hypothetical protein
MKKIYISVGLAATAAGLSSAFAQGMQAASPKLWSVSTTLRGFYDDNYTYGNGNDRQGSWGWEASPSIAGNIDLQQTDFGARYTFGMYYYVQRAEDGVNPLDYTHQGDIWLDHAFDPTFKVNLSDSLVVAQDPTLVNGGTVDRVGGNNYNNNSQIKFTKDWTRHFSTATFYHNDLVVYSDAVSGGVNINGSNPSNAALLNRIEQSVGNDFRWEFQPQTVGFVGYAYSWVRYTGSQQIAPSQFVNGKFVQYYSDSRNYDAHYMYLGAEHVFSPNLSMTGKAGATYVDLYNDPVSSDETSWAPYADLSATYTYIPGSYVQAGFRQDISATSEVAKNSNGQLTAYQKTSTVYLDWTHRFDPKITGTVIGQYRYQSFENGAYNALPENTVDVGVNLNYQINQYFWAEAGYNFDELFSTAAGRSNTRNRVYLGVGASF